MIVANCTTPANYFHILRRQIHRSFRKPLILMTPKSLLRHKLAVSKLKDLAKGSSFHRVLWDDAELGAEYALSATKLVPDEKIRRVVVCSGKVYFDLLEARDARGIDDVYLMRLEQFYPFPALVADQGARPLQAGAGRLVPGGAEEPGGVELRRAEPRMGARAHRRALPAARAMSAVRPPRRPPPAWRGSTRRSRTPW